MKTEDLGVIVEQRGKSCPFYGFYDGPEIFVDQQENQCSMKRGYAPFEMEMMK